MEKGYTIPVHDHGFVRYIDHMGIDLDIVEAARVSYKSPSKGEEADKKLLRYLFKHRHTSPFEMVKLKLNIKLPIFVMRQYIRHRMQNVNELSARYSELPDEFFIPEKWRYQDTKNKQSSYGEIKGHYWHQEVNMFYQRAYELYQHMLQEGIAREQARIVLPVGIYTEFYLLLGHEQSPQILHAAGRPTRPGRASGLCTSGEADSSALLSLDDGGLR